MTYAIELAGEFEPFTLGTVRRRPARSQTVARSTLLLGSLLAAMVFGAHRTAGPATDRTMAGAMPAAPVVAASYDPLLDGSYSFGAAPTTFGGKMPLAGTMIFAADKAPVTLAAAEPVAPPAVVAAVEPAPVADDTMAEADDDEPEALIPFPTPRPPDLRGTPAQSTPRTARRQVAQVQQSAPAVTAPDAPSLLEKLFGIHQAPAGPALAYAAPEDGVVDNSRRRSLGMMPTGNQTAIYDISAHTVTMPDGTQLEAHSGLGDRLDDPRFVHERMRGPTPPHTYDLTMRESLFHGVQALRLNPVGGGGVFGRTGLLAHTFMLGPNGDSNGCVSFRNYTAFLRAYQSGQVKRLLVVAGRG